MEIHLDLMGGMAGDMFIAALLDAHPDLEAEVLAAIACVAPDEFVRCAVVDHGDGVLQGRRFAVDVLPVRNRVPFAAAAHAHGHTSWKEVRGRLEKARLSMQVLRHAVGIFELLAQAEAHVHGVDVDDVTFHEVGAWYSIADVVGAAVLIEKLGATRWTASPAPMGGGRVETAHGIMPVPAPATVQLLLGMPTLDDGIAGERVTPTGAALLRYLCPPTDSHRDRSTAMRTLAATGVGFGTRVMPGISNCLRALCFTPSERQHTAVHRRIGVLQFEVDDQSGEELALGLDRVRQHSGVLDVTQCAVFGKKGRMMVQVQVLARAAAVEQVIDLCFRETTTIGLRTQLVEGVALARKFESAVVDGHALKVKVVDRPGGRTAKTEADDVSVHAEHATRAWLRAEAERRVLDEERFAADA